MKVVESEESTMTPKPAWGHPLQLAHARRKPNMRRVGIKMEKKRIENQKGTTLFHQIQNCRKYSFFFFSDCAHNIKTEKERKKKNMFIENGIIPILGCKHISAMQRKKKKERKIKIKKQQEST